MLKMHQIPCMIFKNFRGWKLRVPFYDGEVASWPQRMDAAAEVYAHYDIFPFINSAMEPLVRKSKWKSRVLSRWNVEPGRH